MAIKMKRGTSRNANNLGMHLMDPTKKQVVDARKEAEEKGIPNIYIHKNWRIVVRR